MKPTAATSAIYIVATSTILHFLVAGQVGLGSDEAHYALYGLHPDWSYFDHPPLVGWIQAIILFFSESDFALRIFPILIFAATNFALYRLVQILFPLENRKLPLISVALFNLALTFQIMGMSMLPEVPLLLMTILALIFFLRALEHRKWQDWIGVGIFLGLAGLSKYTAVTVAITMLLYLVLQRRLALFREPGIWLAIVVAAVIISPVFYWNIIHDWASFTYQIDHGFKARPWSVRLFAISQAGQFVAYTPGLYIASVAAVISAWRERNHPGVQLLILLAIPVFLLFAWGSGFETTLLHWTALAWLGCIPLAARWILFHWQKRTVRIIGWSIPVISLPVILLIYSEFLYPWYPIKENKHPFQQLYGWQEAADRAVRIRNQLNEKPGASDHPAKIFVSNWSLASRLAWYARPNQVLVMGRRQTQFTHWFGKARDGDWGVLVMPVQSRMPGVEGKNEQFSTCHEQEKMKHVVHAKVFTTFIFYVCNDYHE